MKIQIKTLVSGGLMLAASFANAETLKPESLVAYNERMQWFADSQYGMFIHFGLFSELGGQWKGEKVEWYSEWIQASRDIPREEYAEIIKDFNPVNFDADQIVQTAKEAGMTYLVITSIWISSPRNRSISTMPFRVTGRPATP